MEKDIIMQQFDKYSKLSTHKRIDGMAIGTRKFTFMYLKDFVSSVEIVDKTSFIGYILDKDIAYSTKSTIAFQVGKYLHFINVFSEKDYKDVKSSFRHPVKTWGEPLAMEDIINIMDSVDIVNTKYFTKIRNRCLIAMFITIGARVSQLLTLDTDDVDIDVGNRIVIRLNRQKDKRTSIETPKDTKVIPYNISVGDYVIGDLINIYAVKRKEGAFFVSNSKQRLSVAYVEKLMRQIGGHLNIELTPHSFRRFVASLVANKHGIHKAAILLGHSHIETTMRYINPKTVDTSEIINDIYEVKDV